MSQSLKARFNGNTPALVEHALTYGVFDTMEVYDVKDVVCMLNFLHEVAPDKHFQLSKPGASDYAGPDAFDKLLEAMLRKYSKMESANKTLADEITELKKQVDYYKANKWRETSPIVQGLLNYCEGK